jgi:hypothetical protein
VVTFEATGFIKRYMRQRDDFVRSTAAAHLKCERAPAGAPVELKCVRLAEVEKEWSEQDAIVFGAMTAGQTVRAVDLDRAFELGLKLAKIAADIAL